MEGGLISGNSVTKGGGGVYISGESEMEMRGGEISGNAASENTIAGVTVTGNGGGVYVDSGSIFRMTGGTIAKNTARGKGGGVYIDGGKFFKTGGTVYGSDDVTNKNTAEAGSHALATPNTATGNTLPVSGTY
jgi:hypothetical protein